MKKIIKILSYVLLFVSIVIFIFSISQIYKWNKQNNEINEQLDKIKDLVKINKVTNDNNENTVTNSNVSSKNLNLTNVNFSALKSINSDVTGWLEVSGTNINYPFVQTNNNKYYLNHSFDKTYNDAGWLFLDYRNNLLNDKNTIIYAHARLDKTMFGSLKNTLTKDWINNKDNYIVRISTETENTLWEVFSIYHIENTDDYLTIKFNNDNEFLNYIDMIKKRSIYDFNTDVNNVDKILTLSTCYKTNQKLVLHAKLIKNEQKN